MREKMIKKQEIDKEVKKPEDESGRSMVEMLGVLAIMGVLAVGVKPRLRGWGRCIGVALL